jgi:integrase/recombinase XerD
MMARHKPPPPRPAAAAPSFPAEAFMRYLAERGVALNTQSQYAQVVRRALPDPVAALRALVARRAPIGTVQQARAAVGHWLRFTGQGEAEVQALLPPAKGRQADPKHALSDAALVAYRTRAEAEAEPLRSLLLLLPLSGLRVSEACGLTVAHVSDDGDDVALVFRGKGDKPRTVPLGPAGAALLRARVAEARALARRLGLAGAPLADFALFPSPQAHGGDRPISPWTVRNRCADYAADEPLLVGLTPHILRHTYATQMAARGLNAPTLQAILGHADIATTQRYLHLSKKQLAGAIRGIEGL